MSVLIKGMEMPQGCAFCKIKHRAGKLMCCPLCGEYFDLKDPLSAEHRLVNCPLIPVPPHGRLIDEKDIVPKDGYIIADGMACIPVKDIVNAPTVIPADEGNKNG